MTPEFWRQVETLYGKVVDLPDVDRRALLDQADSELRREVESLLAQSGSALDHPAWAGGDQTTSSTFPLISAGTRLGPYKIEKQIGSGGMGQVFRAVDVRLNRAVAIKTCRVEFDLRFQREARAIAKLNHPHICTLYDVGPNYIVMELLEGETLASRLQRGPLSIDQVFRFGGQIADALAVAHSKGIVHRDLKPANIMTTKASAKVLDFGIARFPEDQTLTANQVVVGTPAYMSPEQREGATCDARSDIYAFGLVLREMATGSRAGDLANAPPNFAHVVTRCLESDVADRWQTASDVRKELEWCAAIGAPSPVPNPETFRARRNSTGRVAWAAAALASLGLLAALIVLYRQRLPRDLGQSEFTITLSQHFGEVGGVPVPSPDGRLIAFTSKNAQGVRSIWIRPLNTVDTRQLSGTAGSEGDIVWSPDGAWIAFFADGKLRKIHPWGGPPDTLTAISGFQDAAWGPKGDIIFRPTNRAGLFRTHVTGGPVEALTKLNESLTENSHRFPEFLPDGRHFLFVSRCAERANDSLYLASVDSAVLKKIMPAQARVSYIPGSVLFYRDGVIVAQRFNPDRAALSGDPVPVLTDVAYSAPSLQAEFRVSKGGEVIIAGSANSTGANLVWYGRNGEETGRLGARGDYNQPRISPDGTRVAFESPDPQTGNRDIWYISVARGIISRLTTNVANDWFPVWSPNGRQIAFASDREGGQYLQPYLKTSMDPGSSESRLGSFRFGEDAGAIFDWSRDGRWMAFASNDILIAPASQPNSRFVFLATPAKETGPRFSPDGKWIAYVSDESGRNEIYVRPFSGQPAGPDGKVQISINGSEFPDWSPSGDELYYMSADGTIYAADTRNLGHGATAPPTIRLFTACPSTGTIARPLSGAPYLNDFDTHDGKQFLVVCRAEPPGRFTILLNWKFM